MCTIVSAVCESLNAYQTSQVHTSQKSSTWTDIVRLIYACVWRSHQWIWLWYKFHNLSYSPPRSNFNIIKLYNVSVHFYSTTEYIWLVWDRAIFDLICAAFSWYVCAGARMFRVTSEIHVLFVISSLFR